MKKLVPIADLIKAAAEDTKESSLQEVKYKRMPSIKPPRRKPLSRKKLVSRQDRNEYQAEYRRQNGNGYIKKKAQE